MKMNDTSSLCCHFSSQSLLMECDLINIVDCLRPLSFRLISCRIDVGTPNPSHQPYSFCCGLLLFADLKHGLQAVRCHLTSWIVSFVFIRTATSVSHLTSHAIAILSFYFLHFTAQRDASLMECYVKV